MQEFLDENAHADGDENEHAGNATLSRLNSFAVYGLSNSMNIVLSVPYLMWVQDAEINEKTSSMVSLYFPAWKSVNGTQLDTLRLEISLRYAFN